MAKLWGRQSRGNSSGLAGMARLGLRSVFASVVGLFDEADRPDAAFEGAWRSVVKRRALCALALVGIWCLGLEARLVRLQVFQHDAFVAEATAQQQSQVVLEALRGDVKDRNGNILAYSVQADSIWADPKLVLDAVKTTNALCNALGDCTAKDRLD